MSKLWGLVAPKGDPDPLGAFGGVSRGRTLLDAVTPDSEEEKRLRADFGRDAGPHSALLDELNAAPDAPGEGASGMAKAQSRAERSVYDVTGRRIGRDIEATNQRIADAERRSQEAEDKLALDQGKQSQRLAGGGAAFAQMGQEGAAREAREHGEGTWAEVGRSMLGGLIQGGGSALSGLAEGSDAITRTLRRLSDKVGVRGAFDMMMAPSEALGITRHAQAVGQKIEDVGTAVDVQGEAKDRAQNIVGSAVGQLGGQLVLALGGGSEAAITAYLGQGFDQIADVARAKGKEGTAGADLATIAGAPITAITERYGLGKLLERVPPAVKQRVLRGLTDVAIAGGIEMSQEVAEQLGQNIAVKLGIDPDQDLTEGFRQSAIGGGGAGVAGRLLLGALGVRASSLRTPIAPGARETARANAEPVTQEDEASPLPTDLIARGKSEIADMAGKLQADQILTENRAPSTGTRVRLGEKEAVIEDAFTEDGEAGVALRFGNGQVQKVFLNDLADAGMRLEPVQERAPRDLLAEVGGSEAPATPRPERPSLTRMVDITAQSESGGRDLNPDGSVVTSPVGARGRMQVMPGTARDPGHGIRPSDGSLEDDARVGRELLGNLVDKYGGDPAKAWAAYNWGEGRVDAAVKRFGDDWLSHAPAETQAYVAKNVSALGGGQIQTSPSVEHSGVPEDIFAARSGDVDFLADPARPPEVTKAEPAPLQLGPSVDETQRRVDAAIAMPAAPTIETAGKQVVIRDLDPDQRAAVDAALPGKTRMLPRSDGAFVAPVKHEAVIRATLGQEVGEAAGGAFDYDAESQKLDDEYFAKDIESAASYADIQQPHHGMGSAENAALAYNKSTSRAGDDEFFRRGIAFANEANRPDIAAVMVARAQRMADRSAASAAEQPGNARLAELAKERASLASELVALAKTPKQRAPAAESPGAEVGRSSDTPAPAALSHVDAPAEMQVPATEAPNQAAEAQAEPVRANVKPDAVSDFIIGRASVPETGEPGYSVHHVPGDPIKTVVFRDESGKARGGLLVPITNEAKENFGGVITYVDPEFRRQGIATKLYDLAREQGLPVDEMSGKGDLTPDGAAFVNARRAASAPVEAAAAETPTFTPAEHVGALRDIVTASKASLNDIPSLARKLSLDEDQTRRVIGALAAQPDAPIRLSSGRVMRKATRTGPVDVITFLRDAGGIRDDAAAGHDLAKGRGLARHPGLINNRTGRSVDEAGELLHEAGYFGPAETAERPSTADVLDLIDRADTRKIYKPDEQAAADEAARGRAMDESERRAREEIADTAKEWGVTLSADDVETALMPSALAARRVEGSQSSTADQAGAARLCSMTWRIRLGTGVSLCGCRRPAPRRRAIAEQRDGGAPEGRDRSDGAEGVAGQGGGSS
jgi:GNAT superfamily N-acetyltransferase